MALPKINIIFDVYKLNNVGGKKTYGTANYTNIEGYIYTPEYVEANELFELEGVKGVFRLLTEQTDIGENDRIKDTVSSKEYKVLKNDKKDSNGVRTTFYQLLLTSKI